MPVMVPIMLPRPRLMSMKKNMTDQKGLAGKWVMASVKAMKASPVPCTAWERGAHPMVVMGRNHVAVVPNQLFMVCAGNETLLGNPCLKMTSQ